MNKKAQTGLIIGIIIAVVAIAGAIIYVSNSNSRVTGNVINDNQQKEIACNSPYIKVGTECCLDQNSNNICDKDETQTNDQQIQEDGKTISQNDLISFVEKIIQGKFSESSGTFVKSQDINDAKEKGHGCFTGFSYPCTSYMYPYDDAFSDEVYSHIYDFGEGDSPSLNKILSDQSSFPGVEKRSLQNGDVIVQEYDNPNENPYTGEISSYSRLFEADIPCGNRYWVKIGFYQQDEDFSGEIKEKGTILNSANEILGYCN